MAPGTSYGEIYFIIGMMILILVICVVAVWAFVKTYKKEMKEKAERETSRPGKNGADATPKPE